MYELNEVELATVVGGNSGSSGSGGSIKISKSFDVVAVQANTDTTTGNIKASQNSIIASYNGAYVTVSVSQ